METVRLKTGVLGVNTYLVFDNGSGAFVVDPGGDAQKIRQAAAERGRKIQAVLLTHGHFDHIGALRELQRDGAKVYVHTADAPMLLDDEASLGAQFGYSTEPCRADHLLSGGEELSLCGITIRVIAGRRVLFSGRCDLQRGHAVLRQRGTDRFFCRGPCAADLFHKKQAFHPAGASACAAWPRGRDYDRR